MVLQELTIYFIKKWQRHLLKNKVKNIEKVSPDFISTGNIGCMTQISNGTQIPIIHTVELLDWFTGGPKPYKLERFLIMKKVFLLLENF